MHQHGYSLMPGPTQLMYRKLQLMRPWHFCPNWVHCADGWSAIACSLSDSTRLHTEHLTSLLPDLRQRDTCRGLQWCQAGCRWLHGGHHQRTAAQNLRPCQLPAAQSRAFCPATAASPACSTVLTPPCLRLQTPHVLISRGVLSVCSSGRAFTYPQSQLHGGNSLSRQYLHTGPGTAILHVQYLIGKDTWNSGGPSLRMDSRAGEKYLSQQEHLNYCSMFTCLAPMSCSAGLSITSSASCRHEGGAIEGHHLARLEHCRSGLNPNVLTRAERTHLLLLHSQRVHLAGLQTAE